MATTAQRWQAPCWPRLWRLAGFCLAFTGLLCAQTLAYADGAQLDGPPVSARTAVDDVRVALRQAIDASDGQAHAVLNGAAADAITSRFKGTSPVYIDVWTLSRFGQDGCRRLRLALSQEGVVLPGTQSPQRQSVTLDLNYCSDGLPPRAQPSRP